MATYTAATYAFDMSNTSNFQTLMGDIDSKIQSLGGWTYVSQTGDGNPASTSPGSAGTYPAFRVYSTTVGATTWYLRIDYGHTSSGPSLKIQVGSGVNGSGTLTGQLSTQTTVTEGDTGSSRSLHMSAAAGRLMIFFGLNINSTVSEAGISLHGNVDTSGNMLSGMEIFTGVSTSTTAQYVPASGTVPAQLTLWPTPCTGATSYAFAGVVPLFPPILWDSTGANNPSLAGFVYAVSDLTTNTTTTVNLYGTSRTFIVTFVREDTGLSSNAHLAFRFD